MSTQGDWVGCFSCPFAGSTFERVVSRLFACVRQINLWVAGHVEHLDLYENRAPLRELEYLHHFFDKNGNRVEPISQGLPPEMPEEVRNFSRLERPGRLQDGSKPNGIRLAGRPHDGDVQNGHGTVPRKNGRDLAKS
jgi:hypothetical protein